MWVNSRYSDFDGVLAHNFVILSLTEFIFCAVLVLLYLQYLLEYAQCWWCQICCNPAVLEILRSMCKTKVLHTSWASRQKVINNGGDQILIPYGVLKMSMDHLVTKKGRKWGMLKNASTGILSFSSKQIST